MSDKRGGALAKLKFELALYETTMPIAYPDGNFPAEMLEAKIDIENTIRILEAAKGVDKERAILIFDKAEIPYSSFLAKTDIRENAIKQWLSIRVLIEALPEPDPAKAEEPR